MKYLVIVILLGSCCHRSNTKEIMAVGCMEKPPNFTIVKWPKPDKDGNIVFDRLGQANLMILFDQLYIYIRTQYTRCGG